MVAHTSGRVPRAARQIGENLTTWRKLHNLTAAQVADRAGVSRTTLSKLEHGESGVSLGVVLEVPLSGSHPAEDDPPCESGSRWRGNHSCSDRPDGPAQARAGSLGGTHGSVDAGQSLASPSILTIGEVGDDNGDRAASSDQHQFQIGEDLWVAAQPGHVRDQRFGQLGFVVAADV